MRKMEIDAGLCKEGTEPSYKRISSPGRKMNRTGEITGCWATGRPEMITIKEKNRQRRRSEAERRRDEN